ncbi:Uncharacterised protein [Mycobacteroides abscessus subsp. abscessus]|nr:Uncharacterised protein [Mycobacteroides abscessus subsp. abscessus]
MDELFPAHWIHNADIRIADHAEMLLAFNRIIDIHYKNKLLHVGRDTAKIHIDLLIISISFSSQIIAGMLYAAI